MYRADGPEGLRPVGEVGFANGAAAMSASGLHGPARACAALVGCADLSLGDAVSPPGPMVDAAFRAGAAAVGRAGLSRDVWAYHTQLREPAELAAAVPDLTVVVDHCGGPIGVGPHKGRREAAFAAWSAGMAVLAERPDAVVKLGGLAMRVGGCMFESDVPVDKGTVGHRILWNGCKRLAADLAQDDKRALFAGTARRVCRLDGIGR